MQSIIDRGLKWGGKTQDVGIYLTNRFSTPPFWIVLQRSGLSGKRKCLALQKSPRNLMMWDSTFCSGRGTTPLRVKEDIEVSSELTGQWGLKAELFG
ncbi:hypothetical protein TNCV_3111291 [Trichonephila clavipes]|nr:hypothetical protein TNCV_3111291 [Trichonephila clavipes]